MISHELTEGAEPKRDDKQHLGSSKEPSQSIKVEEMSSEPTKESSKPTQDEKLSADPKPTKVEKPFKKLESTKDEKSSKESPSMKDKKVYPKWTEGIGSVKLSARAMLDNPKRVVHPLGKGCTQCSDWGIQCTTIASRVGCAFCTAHGNKGIYVCSLRPADKPRPDPKYV